MRVQINENQEEVEIVEFKNIKLANKVSKEKTKISKTTRYNKPLKINKTSSTIFEIILANSYEEQPFVSGKKIVNHAKKYYDLGIHIDLVPSNVKKMLEVMLMHSVIFKKKSSYFVRKGIIQKL